jgi:hypothetical protein
MNTLDIDAPKSVEKVNAYVAWLFKKKQPFVVLKRYVNPIDNTVKMFIALPVREREFEVTIEDFNGKKLKVYKNLFNPKELNTNDFEFRDTDIKEYKTIYSGNIFEYYSITKILSRFIFLFRCNNIFNSKEKIIIFRDYTRTKKEQVDSLTLVQSFTDPAQSVESIFRLLQCKYVTIVDVTFKTPNYIDTKKYGN